MIGYNWANTILVGKSGWDDLQTLCALPYYALLPSRHIQFIQWKNGKLHPLDHDEAWKVSSIARLILLSTKNILPFDLNFWLKFGCLVVIWAAVPALIKRDKGFVAAFALTAALVHMLFSLFAALLRRNSTLQDVATCPNTLVEDLDERKKASLDSASKETLSAPITTLSLEIEDIDEHKTETLSASITTLPLELVTKILHLLTALQPFGLTCKWAAKICYQAEFKPRLHLPRLPNALLQSLEQPLLDQMKFMRCTSQLLRGAKNEPVSSTETYTPGKAFLGISFFENQIPLWLPAIWSENRLAPYITVNSDWLGKHHFFYTVTPVKTLALIFTYDSNYKLSGSPSFYCNKDRHVLILTQVSPFHKNEWWLVFQAWSGSEQEYSDAHPHRGNPATFKRNLLNNRSIRILFDNKGQVTPECKAVWNWFKRFLNEEEVGFFDDQENFFPNETTPHQRCSMQLQKV